MTNTYEVYCSGANVDVEVKCGGEIDETRRGMAVVALNKMISSYLRKDLPVYRTYPNPNDGSKHDLEMRGSTFYPTYGLAITIHTVCRDCTTEQWPSRVKRAMSKMLLTRTPAHDIEMGATNGKFEL